MGNSMLNRDHQIKYWDAILQPDGSYINCFGTIYWFNDAGVLHREEGPAELFGVGGRVRWYLHGKRYQYDVWVTALNKTDEEKMLLRLQYA